ncbi:hypothetical protein DERF_004858 [Dermatophagoides farinae]|uniref:Uncharacterized protein n=1 Tax=Dermatophagoides farinae TaxID=6954 RepID=A0A922LAK5_DERFA|nr:hypothetical protein DERF_004858 [Dermatophagoides farinae]
MNEIKLNVQQQQQLVLRFCIHLHNLTKQELRNYFEYEIKFANFFVHCIPSYRILLAVLLFIILAYLMISNDDHEFELSVISANLYMNSLQSLCA